MKKVFVTLLMLLVSMDRAFAVNLPDAMKQSMAQDYSAPSILNLVLSLIFVIALIYITGWVYTKLNIVNRKNLGKISDLNKDNTRFNVLQSMSLGQQRHLYSIEMNNKILLIGSTPSHISLIKEFNKESKDIVDSTSDDTNNSETNTGAESVSIDELYKKYKNY